MGQPIKEKNKPIRLIIAGGRSFSNYHKLKTTCDHKLKNIKNTDIEIVSGTAKGADKLGEFYAKENNISIIQFPPDWNKNGKSAGYKRNAQMAEYATHLIAFWDGKSYGTQHMIKLARKKDLIRHIVFY